MLELIFTISAGIYFILLVFISAGLGRKFSKSGVTKPFVSVIIAARNEEKNIAGCLSSLAVQSYPEDMYEVIVADDHSTDKTGPIIDEFIGDKNNFKKVIPAAGNGLTGKTNALKSAVNCASGEILLFTDGDCALPGKWIESIISYYQGNTGMVNGFSAINADSIMSGIQSIDLVFLVSIAAGMANSGMPASCIGNNMSVRKKALQEAGGYASFPESVTEDYLLINKINSLRKYDIIFPVDHSTLIHTKALGKITDIYRQKKRWASGGLVMPNISLFLMFVSYITNLLVILSVIYYSQAAAAVISLKVFSDLFFLYQIHKKLNLTGNLKYFLFFEIYYIIYTTILPVILLFSRKIIWKGRKY